MQARCQYQVSPGELWNLPVSEHPGLEGEVSTQTHLGFQMGAGHPNWSQLTSHNCTEHFPAQESVSLSTASPTGLRPLASFLSLKSPVLHNHDT